jgi:hypothetical protein
MRFATKKKRAATKRLVAARPARRISPARETLRGLIATREALVTDGALQICLAIATVTNLVTVDAAQDPFVVTPNDLFNRKFNDNKVGMSNLQMPIFKANLAVLLPQIPADIAQIADNAGLEIGDVGDFVADALVGAGQ